MKTFFLVLVLALASIWLLQASGAVKVVPYTEMAAGVVRVQKSRWEWRPERLLPFIQQLPKKGVHFLRTYRGRLRQGEVPEEKTADAFPAGNFDLIRLKNGSQLQGRIVEEKEGVVWIEIEGGRIAFKREEIVSSSKP